MTKPGYDITSWRKRIPLLRSTIPLNNCSQGPLLDSVNRAAQAYLQGWDQHGMDWEGWIGEVEQARAAFARLIGASPDAVAVTGSVSDATSRLASAIDFSGPRRRVVLSEAEFPTVAHVWLAQEDRGAELVWLPLSDGQIRLDDYAAAIDERTAVVSACHGYYLNGALQDLDEIGKLTRAAGALLYTDTYQTAGVRSIDVNATPVDALAAGCLKYLMGAAGIAFLYLAPAVAEGLQPAVTGWFGRQNPFAFDPRTLDWAPATRRFDGGTPPIINAAICRAGIEAILEVGVEAISDWTTHLADYTQAQGRQRGLVPHVDLPGAARAPTTAFVVPDARAVEQQLRADGVLASARGPVIRFAPHFFSEVSDIDHALDLLAGHVHAGHTA